MILQCDQADGPFQKCCFDSPSQNLADMGDNGVLAIKPNMEVTALYHLAGGVGDEMISMFVWTPPISTPRVPF